MASLYSTTVQLPPGSILSSLQAEQQTTSYDSLIALCYSIVLHRFLNIDTYVYLRTNRVGEKPQSTELNVEKRHTVRYNPELTVDEAFRSIAISTACDNLLDDDTVLHEAFLGEHDGDESSNPLQRALALVLADPGVKRESAVLEVNSAVYSKFQARNMASTFSQALRALTGCSEATLTRPLAALDLLSPEDHALIESWNQEHPGALQDCVPDLVERISNRYPAEVAVVSSHDGLSFTYERLNKLASRLGSLLVTKYNLGRGAVIPLCFDKSPVAVVAMLAVLKTGAAYCCLDPQHPSARHNFILQSVNASVVLVSPKHQCLSTSPVLAVDSKFLEELEDTKDDSELVFEHSRPSDTCIVAFSSGSTGVPKGIVHTHETLTTGFVQNGTIHGLNRPGIRVFQWCAYTFDISLTEIWGTLICGGVVCIPSEDERLNDVETAMNRMAVEWAFFTPSFARFFCRQHYRVKTLKTLAVGGEALTQQDAHAFLEDLDLERVVQVFGPAEFITMFLKTITPQDPYAENAKEQSENVPFVPLNAHSWVVDPDNVDLLAPIGAVGELLIEGPALFTGYLNDPQRTNAALIRPPQWRSNMGIGPPVFRIYRSGDLVRYLENGEMRYVSRKDGVVKLRGQFVDLGEIESVLRANLGLTVDGFEMPAELETESAVLLATDKSVPLIPTGDQALVAFIRPIQKNETKERREVLHAAAMILQTQLRSKVPEYMVPRLFYPVDAFPYNASGKLDRKALAHSVPSLDIDKWLRLPGPDAPNLSASTDGRPQNIDFPLAHKHDKEMHQAISVPLKQAWIEVLGQKVSEFSIYGDFFQKGGNSMHAMELVAAARRHGVSVTVGKIFACPVFDQLVSAASISQNARGKDEREEDARSSAGTLPFSLLGRSETKDGVLKKSLAQCQGLNESDVQDIIPATPLQSDFMASGLRRPGTFMAQTWLSIPSQVPVDKFKMVWKQLNDIFSTLRCRVVRIGDSDENVSKPDFLVLVTPQRPLQWVHVSAGTKLNEYLAEDRATPMGYGDALVRYAILDSPISGEQGGNSTMVLTMHQCTYDGFTVKRIQQTMNELLNFQDGSTAIANSPSFTPFIEHITTQSNKHDTEAFWRDYLLCYEDGKGVLRKQQFPFPALPDPSSPIEADSLFATNIQTPALEPNLKHITLPTIILAGWALVMNHYTGNDDIVLPMHVSGRGLPVPGIMDMAFPTIATVPVRVQLSTGLLELLARSDEGPTSTAPRLELRLKFEEFLQSLQTDQIHLGTTAASHAGLDAIATYSESCRRAVDVCRGHPQGSVDIQYATATFRPDTNKKQSPGDAATEVSVDMQVNVQDAKYFSPDYALSLGCYILDGGIVRLVFVYDSKIVSKEQITEYATRLENFSKALVVALGFGDE